MMMTQMQTIWKRIVLWLLILTMLLLALEPQSDQPQEHPNGITFEEVRETIENLTIQPVLPNRYPKGTVLEDMILTELYNGTGVDVVFSLKGNSFVFSCSIYDGPHGTGYYEKNSVDIEVYYVNQIPHYIFPNMDRFMAVWQNGNTENLLCGDLTESEIKGIIDSIYS